MVKKNLLSFIIFLLWTANSQAIDLKVGLGELDYPPFYFEQDGHLSGAAIEIAQNITQKLGHRLEFKRYPWARVQRHLQSGGLDMVILYFKTPERAKDVAYTDTPHIYESSYLIIAKGNDIPYKGTLNDLQSYVFGSVRGYSHGDEYNGAKQLKKCAVNDEKDLIRMLTHGRFDIAVGNKPAILLYAKKEGLYDKITFLSPPIDKGPNYFAFSKTRKDAEELAKEFSTEIKKFITSKRYQNILKKYGFDILE